jgi:beta-aspartyl-peptidase (threonine type)
VRTVKHPISLARLVMTRTRHVLLAADGAEAFADETAVERVPNSYFDTDHRRESLEKVLEERRKQPQGAGLAPAGDDRYFGTVGCVALDSAGNLAAATSTGGLTAKKWGRVGDSPIIGAGNYADNATCAVSCTGAGEQFIRHGVAREIAAMMRYKGSSANAAAEEMIFRRLNIDDGGVIVVSKAGEIAMVFSTEGMYRGAADASGRFEVGIWKETVQE